MKPAAEIVAGARRSRFAPRPRRDTAREKAVALAVRYQAYLEAVRINDDQGIVVWGDSLIEIQTDLGVQLLDEDNVHLLMAAARVRLARKENGK